MSDHPLLRSWQAGRRRRRGAQRRRRRRAARAPRRDRDAHRPAGVDRGRGPAARRPASRSSSAGTVAATLVGGRSDRPEPGRAAAARRRSKRARAAGVPVTGELELASRWLRGRDRRHHRHQGQVDDDDADRPDARGGRASRAGRRQHRPRAERAGRRVDRTRRFTSSRRAAFSSRAPRRSGRGSRCCLNFSPDHLDRHATRGGVHARRKRASSRDQEADGLGRAQRRRSGDAGAGRGGARAAAAVLDGSAIGRSGGHRALRGDAIVRRTAPGDEPLVPLSSVKLLGRHLLADVLAAAAVASLAGVDAAAMTRAVEGFTGLEHALEPVGEDRRRAVRQRLEGDQHRGGAPRDREFRRRRRRRSWAAGSRAATSAICCAPLVERARDGGRDRRGAAADSRAALAAAVPVHDAGGHGGGGADARSPSASPGGTVVLAPACASFDMFRDYAERGRVFKQEVRSCGELARCASSERDGRRRAMDGKRKRGVTGRAM